MPSKNTDSSPHFSSLSFGDTSTFSSRFPVNLQLEEIREVTDKIDSEVDAIFMMHGCDEQFETTEKSGAIPLQPLSTRLAMETFDADPAKRRIMRSRHFTLNALTEGAELRTAHVQIGRESGEVKDFSLVVNGRTSTKDTVCYELRAVINDDSGENVYEIAQHTDDGEGDSILIDESAAKDFVHALRELRAAADLENPSLEAGLLSLIDESKSVSHIQTADYDVNGEANLTLSLERTARIVKGFHRTVTFSMLLQETSFNHLAETNRSFFLAYNGDNVAQPYEARLDYLVRAFDETLKHKEREAMFEKLSIFLRENPQILFQSLGEATSRLARLN
jgi:hypothetical protein